MPKKHASHRDGWTWELLRDAAGRPSTAALLNKFVEHFSNGPLPCKEPMDIPCVYPDVSLSQETSGGEDLHHQSGTTSGDCRVGDHTFWMPNLGKDEQIGGCGGRSPIPPILVWY